MYLVHRRLGQIGQSLSGLKGRVHSLGPSLHLGQRGGGGPGFDPRHLGLADLDPMSQFTARDAGKVAKATQLGRKPQPARTGLAPAALRHISHFITSRQGSYVQLSNDLP
jgi:hypothetical protein